MDSDSELLPAFRAQMERVLAQWRPGPEEVKRFQDRLQSTLERVKADGSPLTLIEQSGHAIADAPSPFEAFAHLSMLEVFARTTGNERLLRYCKLVADVTRLLGDMQAVEGASGLTNLKLAGRTIAAVAAMDRDEPRTVDGRLLELASGGAVAAAIVGLVLQMLADLRGEVPS